MKQSKYIWIFLLILQSISLHSRSIFRKINITIPTIEVSSSNPSYTKLWSSYFDEKKTYTLQSKFLKFKTLHRTYNPKIFAKQKLPQGEITTRIKKDKIKSSLLTEQAEEVLQEIIHDKKEFKHFKILKDRDFNYTTKSGLIVFKYKEYPFVLKLFIEHPHSFVQPMSKGFEAGCIFTLSGCTRHLSGFTRITNLSNAKKALSKDAQYRYYLDFPQKWFWTPKKNPMLEIKWKDDYNKRYKTFKYPSIYGIIADHIECDVKIQKEESHTLRQIAIDVASFLHYTIDPHFDNFMPELNSNKIVLIDTEHFPTMAGFDKTMNANGYIQWYFELTGKFLKRQFCRTKQERIKDQCYL